MWERMIDCTPFLYSTNSQWHWILYDSRTEVCSFHALLCLRVGRLWAILIFHKNLWITLGKLCLSLRNPSLMVRHALVSRCSPCSSSWRSQSSVPAHDPRWYYARGRHEGARIWRKAWTDLQERCVLVNSSFDLFSGCAHCCHKLVYVTPDEGALLARKLLNLEGGKELSKQVGELFFWSISHCRQCQIWISKLLSNLINNSTTGCWINKKRNALS